MWQKIISTESTYGEDKKVFPNFIWQMHFYKKTLGGLHKRPQSPWWQ
jgi:hypothetical protein